MNLRERIKKINLVLLGVFAASYALSALCFSQTSDGKLDRLVYQLRNYNVPAQENESETAPIFSGTFDSHECQFSPIYRTMYYNSLIYSCRTAIHNEVIATAEDSDYQIKLFTQPTFTIRTTPEENGGYYLDYGLHYTYYPGSVVQDGSYLSPRYGADGFVLIADTFADKLLEKYSLSSYQELIQSKTACLLKFTVDGNQELTFSINNVINTSLRSSPRVESLYGDFGVISFSYTLGYTFTNLDFEIDLKPNPYCMKTAIGIYNSLGFTNKNTDFVIKTFEDGEYSINESFTTKFYSIYKNQADILWYVLGFVPIVIDIVYLFVDYKRKADHSLHHWNFLIMTGVFAVQSFIATFTYNYTMVMVAPLIFIVFYYILFDEEIRHGIVSCFKKRSKTTEADH